MELTTWQYSNGAYETNTTIYTRAQGNYIQGQKVQHQRSIIFPIPYTETVVKSIVAQVNPENAGWQQQLTNLLAQEHFFTQNIATSRGTGIDYTTATYFKDKASIWNMVKTTCAATAVVSLWFAPSIVSKIAPDAMKTLELDDETKDNSSEETTGFFKRNISYSSKVWWKILRGDIFSNSLVGGVVTIAGDATLIALSKGLFDQLCKTFGDEEYQKWKTQKVAIFNANKLIPSEFEKDAVLAHEDRICSISGFPIRVPCILNCNHLFEEAMIKNWHIEQGSRGQVPKCPLCKRSITQMRIDTNISDQIELRLFLLQARKINGN
jgi:hypothetical protein